MKQPIDFINYAAWEQGYVPPTNHRLMHALAYEGARVVGCSHMIEGDGWWIVAQGEPFASDEEREIMMMLIERQVARAKKRKAIIVPLGEAINLKNEQFVDADGAQEIWIDDSAVPKLAALYAFAARLSTADGEREQGQGEK